MEMNDQVEGPADDGLSDDFRQQVEDLVQEIGAICNGHPIDIVTSALATQVSMVVDQVAKKMESSPQSVVQVLSDNIIDAIYQQREVENETHH